MPPTTTKKQTTSHRGAVNDGNEQDAAEMFAIRQREGRRLIKLHDQQQAKARSKTEAVALTNDGLPDMRFAEDKVLFSPDPSKRVSDNEPDRRFLENRPDLLEVRRKRGLRKNFIFTDDMMPETE